MRKSESFFCLLIFLKLAFCYNIDTSGSSARIIKPFVANPEQAINNPTFFGYDLSVNLGMNSTPSIVTIGAPKRISANDTTSQNEQPSPSTTGNIVTCDIEQSFPPRIPCNSLDLPPDSVRGDAYGMSVSYDPTQNSVVACSPTKLLVCGSDDNRTTHSMPGYCYNSADEGEQWSTDAHTEEQRCPAPFRDLIFLIDGSGSVGLRNFVRVKNWVIALSQRFDIANNSTRIGVVQYSHYFPTIPLYRQRYIRTEIELGQYTSRKEFNAAVRNISLQRFTTYTGAALQKVLQDFQNSSRYNDTDTSKILILLTDGLSTDPDDVPKNAAAVRNSGIITFAIGVGEANEEELGEIASGDENSTDRVFYVTNFNDLDAITGQLVNQIESAVLEGSQGADDANEHNELSLAQYGFSIQQSVVSQLIEQIIDRLRILAKDNNEVISYPFACL